MVLISPSITSSNSINFYEEINFIDKYYDNMHIDIEDGNAVSNITIGLKIASKIVEYSKSKEKTIHLEVKRPLNYLDNISKMNIDAVFIQADAIDNPVDVVKEYLKIDKNIGVNISNLDLGRPYFAELIDLTNNILVNTTHHDDLNQICDLKMLEIAIDYAKKGKKIWIDGGITEDIFHSVENTKIHACVMGRAVFNNKEYSAKYLNNLL